MVGIHSLALRACKENEPPERQPQSWRDTGSKPRKTKRAGEGSPENPSPARCVLRDSFADARDRARLLDKPEARANASPKMIHLLALRACQGDGPRIPEGTAIAGRKTVQHQNRPAGLTSNPT